MARGSTPTPANTTPFPDADPPFHGARSINTSREISSRPRNSSGNMGGGGGDRILGSAPSRIEVERVILDLLRLLRGSSSTSEQGGIRELIRSPGFRRVFDAISMMQNEPVVRNIVTSLSCDEALWRAILNNNLVRDMRGSITAANRATLVHGNEGERPRSSMGGGEQDITYHIMRWLMDFAKSRIFELVERFRLLVNEVLGHDSPIEKPASEFAEVVEEKVRSSVLLAVIIIIIVVVTRSQG